MNAAKQILVFIFCIGLAFAGLWYYQKHQPAVNYAQCSLCDGKQYLAAYEYFKGNKNDYQVKFPFHSRVVVPWLAAQLPTQNASTAFLWIQWVGTILTVTFLLIAWQWLGVPWYLHITGIGWLLFHWIGLLRFNLYDPITVDVPSYVFHSLLLLLLIRPRWMWSLLIITPLATAQKESWLVIVLLLFLYEGVYQRWFNQKPDDARFWIYAGALGLSIATKIGLNQLFTSLEGVGKNSIVTVLFFIKITLQNPLDLVRWVVAMFMGFGGWWLLAWQKLWSKKLTHHSIITPLLFWSVLHLLLGILAGRDMTRIMFLGFPFIMTLLLFWLKSTPKWVLFFATILSLPILRLLSIMPSQITNNEGFKAWFPEYASLQVVSTWAVYMFLSYWLLAKAEKYLARYSRSKLKKKK